MWSEAKELIMLTEVAVEGGGGLHPSRVCVGVSGRYIDCSYVHCLS